MSNPLPFQAVFRGDPEQLIAGVIELGVRITGIGHKNPYKTFGSRLIIVGESPDCLQVRVDEILRSGKSILSVTGITPEAWEKNARWWEALRQGLSLVGGPQLEKKLAIESPSVVEKQEIQIPKGCPLNKLQLNIMDLVRQGRSNKEMPSLLSDRFKKTYKVGTIRVYISEIFRLCEEYGLEKPKEGESQSRDKCVYFMEEMGWFNYLLTY